MAIAAKSDILTICGPEPLRQSLTLPGTDLQITIAGIVRSFNRAEVYREIENMAGLKHVVVDGERIPIIEDDVVAACWAEACVKAPKLTSLEWLTVGARNADLLALVGARCLVCSRLMADDPGALASPSGLPAAEAEMRESRDPLDSLPSDSV